MVTDEGQEDQLGDEEEELAQEETTQEETEPKPKLPIENDYMAGAMLANGLTFVWRQFLSMFRQYVTQIPMGILVDVSFLLYIFAGYISSRQVVKRTEKEYLKVGLKSAGYSSIMGLLIIYTLTGEPSMTFAVSLAICYFAGSILAGYMEIRAGIRRLRLKASS